MRTAVDTSVILDIVTADPRFVDASERALARASTEGALIVCECVVAEIRPAFAAGQVEEFLQDLAFEFVPSTRASALLAGTMFRRYLERRSRSTVRKKDEPQRVVADFLIGAHAKVEADRLLARDRGYYRDYFEGLDLLSPGG